MCLSLYALLLRMLVIDLNAKNQHDICKGIGKKSGKLFHLCNLLSVRRVTSQKIIHAIIFSDKSGTMDFIFWDLHPFLQDRPPPFFFFFFNYSRSLYSAMPTPNGAK